MCAGRRKQAAVYAAEATLAAIFDEVRPVRTKRAMAFPDGRRQWRANPQILHSRRARRR